MTVNSHTARSSYIASAGDKIVQVGFKIQRAPDLRVYLIPSGGAATLLVYGTHYAINGIGENSPTITLVTAASASDRYVFIRVLDPLQDLALRNQGSYHPESAELEFDRIVMMIQEIDTELGIPDETQARVPRLAPTDVIGAGAYNGLASRFSNLANGTGAQDAVTLSQVQAMVAGIVGGGSGASRVVATVLPAASITYDYAATGLEYIIRNANFPDAIYRCLRLSSGNTYDWFVVVQADR